ncbi:PilZ domain-containing protein [Methylobacterium pseudosasicola]|uniref:PilZ domain-containing protein n=1 Tax=Methylobacterium pseudosasicola TaxID=582667 RepID=A0A1I4HW82_9HYPH|nr:PilZ domain-containing protein [Methylobacterium pseudosasicola]SFL45993.1 PilZ domain-containing protein [Methylobacterium pseudosasicola]
MRVEGALRDVSTGGAALDVEPRPGIGMPVVVGMRRAVVVRHTENGVAVRFALQLRPEAVVADVTF